MSALPAKADIRPRDQDVCFVPKADIRVDSEIRDVRKFVRYRGEIEKSDEGPAWGVVQRLENRVTLSATSR
jgi:hypothetical protein